jgi:hypothetical protein
MNPRQVLRWLSEHQAVAIWLTLMAVLFILAVILK